MINYNPVTNRQGDCLIVGRGGIAIELAIESISSDKYCVLVPANICYAAVLPIIYAGCTPVFCDVDKITGNVTMESIEAALNDKIKAVLIPHMYGNPVEGLLDIVSFLHSKGIVVIEDCASLMARSGNPYVPGTIGDYVVYSTGYSKTIDIGYGGVLFSEFESLKEAELRENKYLPFDEKYEVEWNTFSKVYRVLRNTDQNLNISRAVYNSLPRAFDESFHFSLSQEKKDDLIKSVNKLDEVIIERRRQYKVYKDNLHISNGYIYPYGEGAVPWRFNILYEGERRGLINYCLEHGIPISDWYPRVTPVFDDKGLFQNAKWHEEYIINFPLMISDSEIIRICEMINKYLGE